MVHHCHGAGGISHSHVFWPRPCVWLVRQYLARRATVRHGHSQRRSVCLGNIYQWGLFVHVAVLDADDFSVWHRPVASVSDNPPQPLTLSLPAPLGARRALSPPAPWGLSRCPVYSVASAEPCVPCPPVPGLTQCRSPQRATSHPPWDTIPRFPHRTATKARPSAPRHTALVVRPRWGWPPAACAPTAPAWPVMPSQPPCRLPHKRQKPPARDAARGLGKDLAATYFPTIRTAVSSARESLTAEFGMGSGVTSPPWPPRITRALTQI